VLAYRAISETVLVSYVLAASLTHCIQLPSYIVSDFESTYMA